jgi:DNA-binding transcriptional LysR family regulator
MTRARSEALEVFVRTVESGGFSAAARQLELTPSAVSKLVTRLEDRLGVRLLNRTTRSLSPTAEGEALFRRAQRILAEIEDAEREVTQARQAPRGLLRISSGVAFGLHQFPPVLPEFEQRYPEIRVELSVTDQLVDLVDEGVDLAVRTGRLPDSSLVARKICDLERVICASPDYLKRHGTPRTPEDLAHHNCLRMLGHPELSQWPFVTRSGVRAIQIDGAYAANNAETLLQMSLLGLGIVRLADIVLDLPMRRGELTPILTDVHHVEPVPMHAVMPPGKHRLPKVAAMVDFLVEKFASAPWRVRKRARSAPARRRLRT